MINKLAISAIILLMSSRVFAFNGGSAGKTHTTETKKALSKMWFTYQGKKYTLGDHEFFTVGAIVNKWDKEHGLDVSSPDLVHGEDEEYHCDGEKLYECTNRVVNVTNNIIENLIPVGYPDRYRDGFLSELGSVIHTIEDFHSHSNWVKVAKHSAPNYFKYTHRWGVDTLQNPPLDMGFCSTDPGKTTSNSKYDLPNALVHVTSGYYKDYLGMAADGLDVANKCNHGKKSANANSDKYIGVNNDYGPWSCIVADNGCDPLPEENVLEPFHYDAWDAATTAVQEYICTLVHKIAAAPLSVDQKKWAFDVLSDDVSRTYGYAPTTTSEATCSHDYGVRDAAIYSRINDMDPWDNYAYNRGPLGDVDPDPNLKINTSYYVFDGGWQTIEDGSSQSYLGNRFIRNAPASVAAGGHFYFNFGANTPGDMNSSTAVSIHVKSPSNQSTINCLSVTVQSSHGQPAKGTINLNTIIKPAVSIKGGWAPLSFLTPSLGLGSNQGFQLDFKNECTSAITPVIYLDNLVAYAEAGKSSNVLLRQRWGVQPSTYSRSDIASKANDGIALAPPNYDSEDCITYCGGGGLNGYFPLTSGANEYWEQQLDRVTNVYAFEIHLPLDSGTFPGGYRIEFLDQNRNLLATVLSGASGKRWRQTYYRDNVKFIRIKNTSGYVGLAEVFVSGYPKDEIGDYRFYPVILSQ